MGACLESGVGPAGEHGVAVAEKGEAGDVAFGRVGTMHVLAPARHVAPVLLAQHLRLGRQHLPHRSRRPKLACASTHASHFVRVKSLHNKSNLDRDVSDQ